MGDSPADVKPRVWPYGNDEAVRLAVSSRTINLPVPDFARKKISGRHPLGHGPTTGPLPYHRRKDILNPPDRQSWSMLYLLPDVLDDFLQRPVIKCALRRSQSAVPVLASGACMRDRANQTRLPAAPQSATQNVLLTSFHSSPLPRLLLAPNLRLRHFMQPARAYS
jgi:hypothetical protein